MNLAHIIDPHPADKVAIISRGRPTTYGTLRDQVAHVRGGLAKLGVGKGDRVVLLCSNGRYFVDLYLAALGLGAVTVPLNPASPAPEIEREVRTVGAKVVVVEPLAAHAWAQIDRVHLPTVEHVVATETGTVPGADSAFDDLLGTEQVAAIEVDDDDLAALIFTSGTAGSPRAAMLSHGNLMANLEQGRSTDGINEHDVVFGVLPVFHIFGLNVVLGLTLARGATVVLVQRFDPFTALETITERGITVIPGAPPLWLAFSHFDDAPADSFATVRLALTGAAKMPEEATRHLQQRFGLILREGYGLTEASPVVTSSAGLTPKVGSVGKVLAGMQVRLVDENGDDALEGDSGEIWVKGPNVFKGYLDEPEATARVLTADGWLRTGDIAVVDDDGYLYLVDRAKDLVIVSGFNVYPAEVEEVLMEHPDVLEVGVVGVPHPHTGEAVKAFVVLKPGATAHEDTLVSWCLDNLARYKCPAKILFVDQLPRNLSGKLLRRSLV
ncbi:MAG TPA: AMP-binding protein [Ilumatobacteraceae bacterium]|jgi:long-chain acyl-CoA synthetase|nr:AMP-binding protein [Acidimicrobiaceae bacterium]HQY83550.1 AMP-binding protein [Ilumatobacteraceae bacterium]HRA83406.1 AMP-binding protein [Ilumatobacteraceae bacterium]HRC46065.1 AMP-binding protein [Ilumatobacteraceae bacterium]